MNESYLQELMDKLESLGRKQDVVQHELNTLRREIMRIKPGGTDRETEPDKQVFDDMKVDDLLVNVESPTSEIPDAMAPRNNPVSQTPEIPSRPTPPVTKKPRPPVKIPAWKKDFEKFVGENLISKIGIVILVLGAAIGGQWAISNGMVSPLTRIVLGYILGLGLVGTAIKLKAKYENLSAVILSGGVTILYFMTFFAYSFYGLIPQLVAFGLMGLFTVFTVVAALNYNRQIIAHLGLVGSYAIPFLLSNDSGNMVVLFTYMAIVNIGILAISVRKYWKPLYYVSFFATYFIFGAWIFFDSGYRDGLGMAFGFATLFFLIFYATFLGYKLIRKEQFVKGDVVMLLLNAFAFYGIGYFLLGQRISTEQASLEHYQGLFTIGNALIHFGVTAVIYKFLLADKQLFYLVSGLVLIFLTIAIPVQFDGNWVTLAWLAEAVLLFWIARNRGVAFYEKLSYVGMILAAGSLMEDWSNQSYAWMYQDNSHFTPIFNLNFLVGAIAAIGFGLINYIHFSKKYTVPEGLGKNTAQLMKYLIPMLFIGVVYLLFFVEIDVYWQGAFEATRIEYNPPVTDNLQLADYSVLKFQSVWLINYTMLFLSILAFINLKFLKQKSLAVANLALMGLTLFVFLFSGQTFLHQLWNDYVHRADNQFERGTMNLLIRYISLLFASGMIIAIAKTVETFFTEKWLRIGWPVVFHLTMLAILSFELTNWMDLKQSMQPTGFGLSILWGVYALFLIGYGIFKKNKYLRYLAIGVFGLTLLKLFAYDLAGMDTIGKTVVLISLGLLLLVISFLYNKYKDVIFNED